MIHNKEEMGDTVDLIIFSCLIFCEYLIFVLFTMFRICKFVFFFSKAIIILISVRFLNSRFFPLREIHENENLANITRYTVFTEDIYRCALQYLKVARSACLKHEERLISAYKCALYNICNIVRIFLKM